MENNMKRMSLLLVLYIMSFQIVNAGDFIIGTIEKRANVSDTPLTICYYEKYRDYYPSRIFDIDHEEDRYIVYNLHVVYIDSCSTPRLKSVQVIIPKEFKGVCCSVDSKELVYSFVSGKREILVSIPAIEKDTLTKYAYNVLYTYPFNEPKLYTLVHSLSRENELRENRYVGVIQNTSYTLYYYNFNRHSIIIYIKKLLIYKFLLNIVELKIYDF